MVICSHGVVIFGGSPLKGGLRGGPPLFFEKKFPPKVEKLANLKSQKGFETIGSSKTGAISVSARGGQNLPPPVGERVKKKGNGDSFMKLFPFY